MSELRLLGEYRFRTDSEIGTIEAESFEHACRILDSMLAAGGFGAVTDYDGTVYEITVSDSVNLETLQSVNQLAESEIVLPGKMESWRILNKSGRPVGSLAYVIRCRGILLAKCGESAAFYAISGIGAQHSMQRVR